MLSRSSRAPTLREIALFSWVLVACALARLGAQTDAASRTPRLELTVDSRIRPGDDFFAYANGAWLEATAIPQGRNAWSVREEIEGETRARIARLLDDARSAAPGSFARKAADFRAAWLNDSAVEARGAVPLKLLLDSIDAVTDRAALTRLLGRGMRADVDPLNWGVYESTSLIGLSVEKGNHGERTYLAFLLQGGLGLPDRAQYLSAEQSMQALRARYRDYIAAVVGFEGFDRTDQRAERVLALETAIAATHATREQSASDLNADNLWSRDDFARRAPGIDWSAFFAAAGLERQQSFVVWQPTAITGVAGLIASQPLDVWKDYLRFHVADGLVEVLPRVVAERAAALRASLPGRPAAVTRADRAITVTHAKMSDAVGRMYAERYFPPEQKARVQRIVGNVFDAFVKRVERSTWMSPATKLLALAKLKQLYVGIGYPEQWQDYTDLAIDPADAIGNLQRVAVSDYRRMLARLGAPVDDKEWWIGPHTVGAILVFQQNAYDFSAALLQPPKYDATASDAASYGAIGAIIGHDVSHFVDALGAAYDVGGAARHWWTGADSARFQQLAEPLVRQFAGYHPFPDASIDGRLTETENIADLAGLAAAFDAYRATLGARAADRSYVRAQDREFFIGWAQGWRTKMNDAAMRSQLTSDHAPAMYRVDTVRNLDAWYDAFDVISGQRLFLDPKARVRIW